MGKELYLLRHAKSPRDDTVSNDRERPLNSRGHRDARRMGAALAAQFVARPIFVSPALRAQQTLAGLQEGWPALRDHEHQTVAALYTFVADDIVAWIAGRDTEWQAEQRTEQQTEQTAAQDAQREHLFVLGHNPALTDLANWLCTEPVLANLPTAGFIHLQLSLSHWAELGPGCGRLQYQQLPRDLPVG